MILVVYVYIYIYGSVSRDPRDLLRGGWSVGSDGPDGPIWTWWDAKTSWWSANALTIVLIKISRCISFCIVTNKYIYICVMYIYIYIYTVYVYNCIYTHYNCIYVYIYIYTTSTYICMIYVYHLNVCMLYYTIIIYVIWLYIYICTHTYSPSIPCWMSIPWDGRWLSPTTSRRRPTASQPGKWRWQ